jgi:hypothetical protein
MNERIEEIFERMFSPQPIPQSVRDLYKATKFFQDRIDGASFHQGTLALLAAFASKPAEQPAQAQPKLPDEIDSTELVETEPAQPETVVQPGAPTGPMDAPIKPPQGNPKTDLQLQVMTARELKVHAKQCYGKDWPLRMGKKQMIVALKALKKAKAAR